MTVVLMVVQGVRCAGDASASVVLPTSAEGVSAVAVTTETLWAFTPDCVAHAVSLPTGGSGPALLASAAYAGLMGGGGEKEDCFPFFAFAWEGSGFVFTQGSEVYAVSYDKAGAKVEAELKLNLTAVVPVGWGGGYALDAEAGVVLLTGAHNAWAVSLESWKVLGSVQLDPSPTPSRPLVPLDGMAVHMGAKNLTVFGLSSLDHDVGSVSVFPSPASSSVFPHVAGANLTVLPAGAGWPFHLARTFEPQSIVAFSSNGTTRVELSSQPPYARPDAFVPLPESWPPMSEIACDGPSYTMALVGSVWTRFIFPPGSPPIYTRFSSLPPSSQSASHACVVLADNTAVLASFHPGGPQTTLLFVTE